MIAREYNRLLEDALVTDLVVLLLAGHEDELRQQLNDRVERQDVVPDVVRRVVSRPVVLRVALALAYSLAAPAVEGDEAGRLAVERRRHVALRLVHGEVDDGADLELDEPVLVVAFVGPLVNGVAPRGSLRAVLELNRGPRDAVDEQHEVDARVVVYPNLLHHGEAVRPVLPREVGVEVGGGLPIEQVDVDAAHVDAAAKHVDLRGPL